MDMDPPTGPSVFLVPFGSSTFESDILGRIGSGLAGWVAFQTLGVSVSQILWRCQQPYQLTHSPFSVFRLLLFL